ncbi:MAG: DUF5367 domain-containing protein [Timaviella obliquedivisa GSE-PSE-MK23-08B]|nr:DUF5367 domain-containing protein [Timaviella obliquedivisa GSE-PSE-MK23-08B]
MQQNSQLLEAKSDGQLFDKRISYRFFFGMSFLIWLIATVVLRLWGHTLFVPASNLSMISSFLFSLTCLPLLVYVIFQWQKVPPHQRPEAAMYLAIPGMLLDVVTTYLFRQAFPNILSTANGAFGAWLLWGYAIVLVTGLVTSRNSKPQSL